MLLPPPSPGLVGLSLSYSLSITMLLSGLIFNFTQTEMQLVSVERTEEYSTDLPTEPQNQNQQVGPEQRPHCRTLRSHFAGSHFPSRWLVVFSTLSWTPPGPRRAGWSSAVWFWSTGTASLTPWTGSALS